jgi:hypothetical protein
MEGPLEVSRRGAYSHGVLAVRCMKDGPGGHGRDGAQVEGKVHTVFMSRLDQIDAVRGLFS